jgi:hypothetical protein
MYPLTWTSFLTIQPPEGTAPPAWVLEFFHTRHYRCSRMALRATALAWTGARLRARVLVRLSLFVPRGQQFLAVHLSLAAFSHTEMCVLLSPVKGSRFQSLQRSRNVMPASRAIRSSSDGHT